MSLSPNWNWNNPELRAQLRIGTVLMTYDCHCFVVREIRPEGVISREWHDPTHLWTWDALIHAECVIYGFTDLATEIGPGMVARERSGRLRDIQLPDQEAWERLISEKGALVDRAMDEGLAAEILRASGGISETIILHAQRPEHHNQQPIVRLETAGSGPQIVEADYRLRHAVSCLYRAAAVRQPVAWNAMTFRLNKASAQWRYEVSFEYE